MKKIVWSLVFFLIPLVGGDDLNKSKDCYYKDIILDIKAVQSDLEKRIKKGIDTLNKKFCAQNEKIDNLDQKVQRLFSETNSEIIWLDTVCIQLGKRIDDLEKECNSGDEDNRRKDSKEDSYEKPETIEKGLQNNQTSPEEMRSKIHNIEIFLKQFTQEHNIQYQALKAAVYNIEKYLQNVTKQPTYVQFVQQIPTIFPMQNNNQ